MKILEKILFTLKRDDDDDYNQDPYADEYEDEMDGMHVVGEDGSEIDDDGDDDEDGM